MARMVHGTTRSVATYVFVCVVVGLTSAQTVSVAPDELTPGPDRLDLFARTMSIRAAVVAGNLERVRSLLETNPSWKDSSDLEGNALVAVAAEKGHAAVLELLLAQGARVNATNKTGHSALHAVALTGQREAAALLLEKGADLRARCVRGMTPVQEAAEKGYTAIVELLLAKGAPVHGANNEGDTLLHFAAANGNLELTSLLLANRANVAATNKTGHSALHAAALRGQTKAAALLLKNGADARIRCVRGMTPAQEAVEKGYAATAELLLAKSATVQGANNEGNTLLHMAAASGNLELTGLLLTNRADVAATNLVGDTPLHLAASQGNKALVEMLLAHGANAAAENAAHVTALDQAAIHRRDDCTRVLRLELARLTELDLERRLSILVLPFRNETGDSEQAHWQVSAPQLVDQSLQAAGSLHVLADSAAKYGLRALRLRAGDSISAEQVRKIGELTEARRVIWGEYGRSEEKWNLRVRVMNVATGETSRQFEAASSDWFAARDEIVDQLAAEWHIQRTPELTAKMRRHETTSAEALALLSRATAASEQHRPIAEIEQYYRRACAADPAARNAQALLAATLANQGRMDEAEPILRAVIAAAPDRAESHFTLGALLLYFKNERETAHDELQQGLRSEPHNVAAHMCLGELFSATNQWEMALHHWTQARCLQPTDPEVHALLALAFAHTGDRTQALREVQQVERLDPAGENVNSLQSVTRVYDVLGDAGQAVAWMEKFVKTARSLDVNPEQVQRFERRGSELKARLVPIPVKAARPRLYSERDLQAALEVRLTPAEMRLVANPLASPPALQEWAHSLTRQITDDPAKAKALFDELSRRPRTVFTLGAARTAAEVSAAWSHPEEQFSCNEFAKLYVALARAVDLDAFFVHLESDYQGRIVYHDCAIVFLDNQGFLVDPAYRWFGVPHREFVVLDDLQAVAHHLAQGSAGDERLARVRAAVKVFPDLPWHQIALARVLVEAERLQESEEALTAAQQTEPDRWDWYFVKGAIAVHRDLPDKAVEYLQQALQRNPNDAPAYLWLGNVLRAQHKFREARDAYRAALNWAVEPKVEREATRLLAEVIELLGQE
jgi:ankyrin repeat protein/tetratricopeptide (TPR) repeat protein